MHLHYFTLKRQVDYLSSILIGGHIVSSYTQRKNEQILGIQNKNGKIYNLLLSADPVYPFILLRETGKRPKNSTDVLTELMDNFIHHISLLPNDRVVRFDFTNREKYFLVQLFSNNSNFFICDQTGAIVSAFKRQKKFLNRIYHLEKISLMNPMQLSEEAYLVFLSQHKDLPLEFILRKKFLFLSSIILNEIVFRLNFNIADLIKNISTNNLCAVFQQIQLILRACLNDFPQIYLKNNIPQHLVLTEFKSLQHLDKQEYQQINDALISYVFKRNKAERYHDLFTRIKTVLKTKIEQIDKLIIHLKSLPTQNEQKEYYQKIGELLMTQMYQLPKNETEVSLIDYFDPNQSKCVVKLLPNLSYQENAERFFKKAKESTKQQQRLTDRLENLGRTKIKLETIFLNLGTTKTELALKKIEKKLNELQIIQPVHKVIEEISRPYKTFRLNNWEIWVGRNAKANDEMTFQYAYKEDFWLHAQGVSGSHVIVRNPRRENLLPPSIVNFAASIAARFSQAKHSSYVPVIITKVKYVRKSKGSAPGAVKVERIKTIFIEPLEL